MHLEILSYHPNAKRRLNDLREIFFLSSSKKDFASEQEKNDFFERWAGLYINNWPDDVYFCCDDKTDQTYGYLLGCRDTMKAVKSDLPVVTYPAFAKHYAKFPAHLHINMHPNVRAKGGGSFLIHAYLQDLKKIGVSGVHAITAHGDDNNHFYEKNNFLPIEISRVGNSDLVFYGHRLKNFLFF